MPRLERRQVFRGVRDGYRLNDHRFYRHARLGLISCRLLLAAPNRQRGNQKD